jgi:hypothetical protein
MTNVPKSRAHIPTEYRPVLTVVFDGTKEGPTGVPQWYKDHKAFGGDDALVMQDQFGRLVRLVPLGSQRWRGEIVVGDEVVVKIGARKYEATWRALDDELAVMNGWQR